MVTAEGQKDNVLEAVKAGVSNYIIKPFTPDPHWRIIPLISDWIQMSSRMILSFSRKHRDFCPSYHQKRVVEFGEWLCLSYRNVYILYRFRPSLRFCILLLCCELTYPIEKTKFFILSSGNVNSFYYQ